MEVERLYCWMQVDDDRQFVYLWRKMRIRDWQIFVKHVEASCFEDTTMEFIGDL